MIFTILERFHQIFSFYLILPLLLFLGIHLSFRLKFLQFSQLKSGFLQLFRRGKGDGSLSHYQAIASVLAGNFGTGNISGMAVALTAGGPGALVWMWIMAFLGSIIQYASCFLAVKYREKNLQGEYVGGPMYYLSSLGWKGGGKLFAFLVLLGALGVGVFAQINSMSLSLSTLGISPLMTGIGLTLAIGMVTLGGVYRVAKVSSTVIPLMALLYMGSAFLIICFHLPALPGACKLLFLSACGKGALVSGALGYSMMQIVGTGLTRALFATDVGTGYVPILQAGSKVSHPVVGGVISLIAPFLVMIVCTLTALVLILTGAFAHPELKSTHMVLYAFQQGVGKEMGLFVVNVALLLFGYTTILAWGSCFERAIGFLTGDRLVLFFRFLFIAFIPLASFLKVDFVWLFADVALSLMTLCNLLAIFRLSHEVTRDTRDYFAIRVKG